MATVAATIDSHSQQHCDLFCKCRGTHSKNNHPPGNDKVGNFMPCCLSCGIPVSLLWHLVVHLYYLFQSCRMVTNRKGNTANMRATLRDKGNCQVSTAAPVKRKQGQNVICASSPLCKVWCTLLAGFSFRETDLICVWYDFALEQLAPSPHLHGYFCKSTSTLYTTKNVLKYLPINKPSGLEHFQNVVTPQLCCHSSATLRIFLAI